MSKQFKAGISTTNKLETAKDIVRTVRSAGNDVTRSEVEDMLSKLNLATTSENIESVLAA